MRLLSACALDVARRHAAAQEFWRKKKPGSKSPA
jgi:hypothetical protein